MKPDEKHLKAFLQTCGKDVYREFQKGLFVDCLVDWLSTIRDKPTEMRLLGYAEFEIPKKELERDKDAFLHVLKWATTKGEFDLLTKGLYGTSGDK